MCWNDKYKVNLKLLFVTKLSGKYKESNMVIKQIIGKYLGYMVGTLYQGLLSRGNSNSPIKLIPNPCIVFALYGGLGDAIMTLPALKMLRNSVPGLELAVYVEEKTAFTILELSGLTDHLMLMDHCEFDTSLKRWRFVYNRVRPLAPKVAIRNYLHTRFQDSVESYFTGANERIGYIENRWSSIDTAITYTKPYQHRVQDNAELLAVLGLNKAHLDWPSLALAPEDIQWATKTLGDSLKDKAVIGIHPGGKTRDKVKRWPEEHFARLIDLLIHRDSVEVILFGGPHDGPSIQSIVENAETSPRVAASQPLSQTAALIKNCDIFVSNDSGLMHLAALLKVPVVGLFGPTSPVKTGPWGTRHRVIVADCKCSPCWRPGYHGCQNGDCMRTITVDRVYSTVSQLIPSRPMRHTPLR